MEDRINSFERMHTDNPDNPTGLLALANEYGKAERHEDEAVVRGYPLRGKRKKPSS